MTAKEKDEKQFEEIKEKADKYYFDADKKESKTIHEIFMATTKIQEIWVDEPLGCEIKIGHISMNDTAELMAMENKNLMGLEMLYRLLLSAEPKTKKAEVYGLPVEVATAMINAIMKAGLGFQQVMKPPSPKQAT